MVVPGEVSTTLRASASTRSSTGGPRSSCAASDAATSRLPSTSRAATSSRSQFAEEDTTRQGTVLDGGLVIDLSRMRRVHVDRDVRIARAEGGSTWFDFDTATVAEGFGTPGGVVGSTGVCGLALGGGIGHLTSQHGLTCDNIVGAALVMPDGSFVRANADENPELLWAWGGGGNFGVATHLGFDCTRCNR